MKSNSQNLEVMEQKNMDKKIKRFILDHVKKHKI